RRTPETTLVKRSPKSLKRSPKSPKRTRATTAVKKVASHHRIATVAVTAEAITEATAVAEAITEAEAEAITEVEATVAAVPTDA
ncbi:MAG: hypothetical protein ACTH0M_02720, partial [Brevibacterium yomogidense]